MRYFGDESGNFNQAATDQNDVFAMAVIGGESPHPSRCPKYAIRESNKQEAKWNDLTEWEKSRFVNCLDDLDKPISIAHFTLTYDDIRLIPVNYELYSDNGGVEPNMALDVKGIGYGCLLAQLDAAEKKISHFTFDQVISTRQSRRIDNRLTKKVVLDEVSFANSRMTTGIQAADCIAGAAREDRLKGTNWLSEISEKRTHDIRNYVQGELELFLRNERTGP